MFAKGRQPKGYSAKAETLKRFPDAKVKRKAGGYEWTTQPIVGFGLFLEKGQDWSNATPVIIKAIAEDCWEEAMHMEIGSNDQRPNQNPLA